MFFRFNSLLLLLFSFRQTAAQSYDSSFLEGPLRMSDISRHYLDLDVSTRPILKNIPYFFMTKGFQVDTLAWASDEMKFVFFASKKEYDPFKIQPDSSKLIITENRDTMSDGRINRILILTAASVVRNDSIHKSQIKRAFKTIKKQVNRQYPRSDFNKSRKKAEYEWEQYHFRTSIAAPSVIRLVWGETNDGRLLLSLSMRVPILEVRPSGMNE